MTGDVERLVLQEVTGLVTAVEREDGEAILLALDGLTFPRRAALELAHYLVSELRYQHEHFGAADPKDRIERHGLHVAQEDR